MKNKLQELLSISTPKEFFLGHYLCASLLEDEYYELHVITNQDYMLSLLVDDTWAYNEFITSNRQTSKDKIVFYIVHPDIHIEKDFIEIKDKDFLYYLPFNRVCKYFLSENEYRKYEIPDSIEEILKKGICRNLTTKEKSKPVLSIITTVFNNAKMLEQAIQSVINQNNPFVEYVIKDACSKDKFGQIIDKYKDYIDIVLSNPDEGIYYGMHQGIESSHGEYVQILNSDDIFFSEISNVYVQEINRDHLDFYGASVMFHKGRNISILKPNHVLNHKIRTNHTTIVMKRELYDELGGYAFEYRCAGDRHLLVRMLMSNASHRTINVPVVHFRAIGFSTVGRFSDKFEVLKIQWLGYKWDVLGYVKLFNSICRLLVKKTILFFFNS